MYPSLSTMWMQNRAERVIAWWEMVQPLGFRQIELSHIVTPTMLAGAHPGALPVSSVHYPAPTTPHPTDPRTADHLLSSPDESLRQWAVNQGRQCIETAAAFGAQAVCLHAGRVEIPSRWEWTLRQRYEGGFSAAPIYQETLTELLAVRRAAAAPYLKAIRQSLTELASIAQAAGVRLGIETRLHITEIPSLDEAQLMLAEHDPGILGLWLDVGHVQVQANLGMPPLAAWLGACGPRIVAAHLHDTRRLRDHLIPGAGEIDFHLVAAHLPAEALRVCEIDWYFTPAELRAGVAHLAAAGVVSSDA